MDHFSWLELGMGMETLRLTLHSPLTSQSIYDKVQPHKHRSSVQQPLMLLNPIFLAQPSSNANGVPSTTGMLRIASAHGIYMQAAPSIPKTLPLIHSPSCEARKQTTRAMSMGRPTRWRGDQVQAYSSTSSSDRVAPLGMYSRQTLWYMSVLMPPGATALTVIFLSPKSAVAVVSNR